MSLYRMPRLRKCGVVISILMTFLFLLGFSKTLHCSSKTVVKMTGDDQEFDLASLSSTYMSQALWVNAMIKSSIQGSRRYFPRTAAVNPDLLESILPIVENHLRNQADLESFLAKPVINSHEYAYIHVPSRTCAEDKPEVLIVVPSAPSNFAKRQKVRDGDRGAYVRVAKNKAKLLFFAGRQSLGHPNTTIQEMLNKEAKEFGDIVQEDFEDKYKNIRLKAMSMLKWAVTQCAEAKFILRSDDDVKINITKVVSVMRKTKKRYANFVLGRMRVQDHPKRGKNTKYYLSETEYPHSTFPPYVLGGLLGYPLTTVRLLYEAALREPPIWLDDVYITGICAAKVKVPVLQDRDFNFVHRAW